MGNNQADMIGDMEKPQAKYHIWGLLAALGLGAIILLPTLWYDLGGDQAHYNYVAWAWLDRGMAPCKTTNVCDLPGVVFVSLLALKAFGINVIALRILDFVLQLLNLGLIFYLTAGLAQKRQAARAGVIASSLYAISYLGMGHLNTAERDGFGLPFLLLAGVCFLKLSGRRNVAGIALAGLMTGVAIIMKPTLGIAGLAFSALYFHRAWKLRSSWPKIISEQGVLLACGLLPLIVSLAVYALSGTGFWFWKDCSVFMSQVYALRTLSNQSATGARYFNTMAFMLYPALRKDQIIWLGLALYFLQARLRDENREIILTVSLLLIASTLSYFAQVSSLDYHRIPLTGFACIFAGAFWGSILGGQAGGRLRTLLSASALVICVLALEGVSLAPRDLKFIAHHSFRDLHSAYMDQEPWYHRTAEYIENHTTPDQYVGSFGGILFLAKRLSPTRHTSFMPIQIKDPAGNFAPVELKWHTELCNDLQKNQPQYFTWLDRMSPISCLKEYVDKNYILETQITDIHGLFGQNETAYIYRRK